MNPNGRLSPALQGILLMVMTVFLFSMMDAIAKGLTTRFDTFQVVWARYASQTLVAVLILSPRLKTVVRTRYFGMQLVRSAFLFAATICFFLGIARIGLAEASAIMSVNPMLISVGAFLLLGEPFGIRRALGVSFGLLGALIIIRPGSDVFSLAALFPLAAACFYAAYSLSTRFLGREETIWTSFLYTAAIGTLVASLIVPWFWTRPEPMDWALMLLLGIVGGLGQLCLIRALAVAEAGAIAPFAYAGIVFATTWGYFIFGETPDAFVYLGAIVIIGAGIYVWYREYTLAKRAAAAVNG